MKLNTEELALWRRLEQATRTPETGDTAPANTDAPSTDAPSTDDDEALQLREGWLLFRQLLAEAEAEPGSSLVRPVTAIPVTAIPVPPIPVAAVARPSVPLRWLLVTACSAAMVAAACVGIYFTAMPSGSDSRDAVTVESSPVASVGTVPIESATPAGDAPLAWDDELDDPVAVAHYEIWRLQSATSLRDRSWYHLSEKLYGLSEDLESL